MTLHALRLVQLTRHAPRVDRVVMAIFAVFAGILLLAPAQFGASVELTAASLLSIAPYLLASVLLVSYLKAAGAERLISRAFSGSPRLMIVTAALFGALSPFCSCGVIPLIAALLAMGVPLAPVMAFWVSSPLMAPDMFVITAGELGLGFAIARMATAIGMGLMAGFVTGGLQGVGFFPRPLREGVGDGSCAGSVVRTPQETRWAFWRDDDRRPLFARTALDTAWFLGRWMTLAFVLESLMVAYLPADMVAGWLGGGSAWAIPLSVAVGVPAYLNGYAAVPLVGGLMSSGMAPGAALAFMTAGAVTCIPAGIAVYALARRPVFALYLALALVGSALSGVIYQLVA